VGASAYLASILFHVTAVAGACPTEEALVATVRQLVPQALSGDGEGALSISVTDLGARYHASVGGVERDFADPARRCDERAKTIALWVALVLEPPSIAVPPRSPPTLAVPMAREPPPRRRLEASLEVSGALELAPGGAPYNTPIGGGGAIRLSLSGRYVGGVLGVGAISPSTLDLGVARAELTRVPFDLSARAILRRRLVELDGDLGVVAAIVVAHGAGTPVAESGTRLDLGLRVAGQLRVWPRSRVAPFALVQMGVFPRPYNLTVEPLGTVGTTPRVWLGGAVGLAVRID
jgi:hypothetical protein